MVSVRRVLLIAVIALAPMSLAATVEWTGASAPVTLWSDPGNWVDGHVPAAGDDLVFPLSRPSTSVNDLPTGTEFRSITIATITSGRYTISGNRIRLGAGGLSVGGAYHAPHTLEFSIELTADQVWRLSDRGRPYFHRARNHSARCDRRGHALIASR